jgi:hypothetical protein
MNKGFRILPNRKLLVCGLIFGLVWFEAGQFFTQGMMRLSTVLTWDNLALFTAQDWNSLAFVMVVLTCWGLLFGLSGLISGAACAQIIRRL